MKKIRLFFRNIPRKIKILLNCALILVLAFQSWLLLGSPAGIGRIYRRVEKANLVGPGEILAILENPGYDYEYLILGQDNGCVTGYFHDTEDPRRTQFICRERIQDMALLSFPADNAVRQLHTTLPLWLFDGQVHAARAEMILSFPDGSSRSDVLQACRETEGFFRFSLEISPDSKELVDRLRLLSGNTMADRSQFPVCATVRLYDEKDSLLKESLLLFE